MTDDPFEVAKRIRMDLTNAQGKLTDLVKLIQQSGYETPQRVQHGGICPECGMHGAYHLAPCSLAPPPPPAELTAQAYAEVQAANAENAARLARSVGERAPNPGSNPKRRRTAA